MNKNMIRGTVAGTLATAALATGLVMGTGTASAGPVQTGTYNLRSGPGTGYPVIGSVVNPNCDTIGGKWPNAPRIKQPDGMWFNVRGGWIRNDGWCI